MNISEQLDIYMKSVKSHWRLFATKAAKEACKVLDETWETYKEAEKAAEETPEWKAVEKARKDYKKAWKDYIGAKEKKQESAKVHDEAVEAVYATPEYVEWDAMCTTQEALDELWK